MIELVDSHCHLDQPHFDSDREAVIARAAENGVTKLINPGVDLPSSRAAVALARQHPCIYAAVGVHPHDARTLDAAALDELKALARAHKNAAIGEIGLDYYWDSRKRDLQLRIFQSQLDLAEELSLPVVVHIRDKDGSSWRAMEDALAILGQWTAHLKSNASATASAPGELHSFSGDLASAERAVSLGFMLGICGPVTFKNAKTLRKLVQALPLENLLTETDAPFLAPAPHRGRRNEPAYVCLIAEEIARLRENSTENVSMETYANAKRLFHW